MKLMMKCTFAIIYISTQDEELANMTDKGHFSEVVKIERIDSSITPVKVNFIKILDRNFY